MHEARRGRIVIPPGVYPEDHELATVKVLSELGFTVKFISVTRSKGAKTPDIDVEGEAWEMKAPLGNGKKTVEHQLNRAGKQAHNVLLDTRRTKMPDTVFVTQVARFFRGSSTLKKVRIILKTNELFEMAKKDGRLKPIGGRQW
jgi:hypothetical protein